MKFLVLAMEKIGRRDLDSLVFPIIRGLFTDCCLLSALNLAIYAKHVEIYSKKEMTFYLDIPHTATESSEMGFVYLDWKSETSLKVICESQQPLIMTNMKTQRSVTLN